jgi:hypothetical protein
LHSFAQTARDGDGQAVAKHGGALRATIVEEPIMLRFCVVFEMSVGSRNRSVRRRGRFDERNVVPPNEPLVCIHDIGQSPEVDARFAE